MSQAALTSANTRGGGQGNACRKDSERLQDDASKKKKKASTKFVRSSSTHALTARAVDRADLVKKEGGSTTTRSHTLPFPFREASSAKAATSALTNAAVPSRAFARAFLVAVRTARAALSTCP